MDGSRPLTVLSIHDSLAPFPQLNNCIHIHPSVREIAESATNTLLAFLRSPLPLNSYRSFLPLPHKRRPYNGLVTGKISPRSNLRSNCTLEAHHVAEIALASARAAKRRIRDVWSEVIALDAEGMPDDLHARYAKLKAIFRFFHSAFHCRNNIYVTNDISFNFGLLENKIVDCAQMSFKESWDFLKYDQTFN